MIDFSVVVVVTDTDVVYRRLSPQHIRPADGTVRPNAFKYSGRPLGHVSVDLARLTSLSEFIARSSRPGARAGEIDVRDARSLDLSVEHTPSPENGNYAHCDLFPVNSDEICDALSRITRLVADEPVQ